MLSGVIMYTVARLVILVCALAPSFPVPSLLSVGLTPYAEIKTVRSAGPSIPSRRWTAAAEFSS